MGLEHISHLNIRNNTLVLFRLKGHWYLSEKFPSEDRFIIQIRILIFVFVFWEGSVYWSCKPIELVSRFSRGFIKSTLSTWCESVVTWYSPSILPRLLFYTSLDKKFFSFRVLLLPIPKGSLMSFQSLHVLMFVIHTLTISLISK